MRSRRTKPERRGAAAVETAFVLPVLLVLMVLMWDLGQLIRGLQVVSIAARDAGRQASSGTRTSAQVKAAVLNTLTQNGVSYVATDPLLFTFQDVTSPAVTDPMLAAQDDVLTTTVSIDFSQMKFASAAAFWGNRITMARVAATAEFRSMRDLPVTIPWTLPVN